MAFDEKNKHYSWSYGAKRTSARRKVKRQVHKRQRQIVRNRVDAGYYGEQNDTMEDIAFEEFMEWLEYERQGELMYWMY